LVFILIRYGFFYTIIFFSFCVLYIFIFLKKMAVRNIPSERFRRSLLCPDDTKPKSRQMIGVAFPGVEFPSVSASGRGTSELYPVYPSTTEATGNYLSPICSMSLREIAEIARVREKSLRPQTSHSLQPSFEYFSSVNDQR